MFYEKGFSGVQMIGGYQTIDEVSEKWGISSRRVRELCNKGRVEGAVKFGANWAIPEDAVKPTDKRVTTGEYRNWRKKPEK